jgi:hypothetical protein
MGIEPTTRSLGTLSTIVHIAKSFVFLMVNETKRVENILLLRTHSPPRGPGSDCLRCNSHELWMVVAISLLERLDRHP